MPFVKNQAVILCEALKKSELGGPYILSSWLTAPKGFLICFMLRCIHGFIFPQKLQIVDYYIFCLPCLYCLLFMMRWTVSNYFVQACEVELK